MSSTRRAYLAWVVVCLVWGTTYLAIRIGLETIPPFLLGAFRWIVAGSLILAVLKARGDQLPQRRTWGSLGLLGVLLLGFGNGGVVWAERTVPSGLTAVLVAMSPFWMVGFEACMPDGDVLTPRQIVGLIVGFGGIIALVWPEIRAGSASVGGNGFLGGAVATQLACLGWAVGSTWSKRHGKSAGTVDNVLAQAALQMLLGGLALLAVASVRQEWRSLTFTPRTLGALAYLTLVGAIAGFSAYAYALRHLPVAVVSLYAYVNPVIAVVLGTLVLREPFNARMAVSAGVVLTGIALVSRYREPAGRTLKPVARAFQARNGADLKGPPYVVR
jgi:drug/metabolite transporter (DMT)-like permease